MKHCQQCQTTNPEQARFCQQCGSPLVLTCDSCGNELTPDARFCMHCGKRVTTPRILSDDAEPSAAETLKSSNAPVRAEVIESRRLVTVLFADLAGWTGMVEQLDPEEVQALQQAYFATMRPAIAQHGGRIEKYIGDAVLAVFGVPQTHEDDPERAVHAALAMQDGITTLNEEFAAANEVNPLTLSLRIGVHTGLVVSSMDKDGDFVVTGDAVNVASRLESAAQPGTVLVSKETHQLVSYRFETEALPPLAITGKSEPITTFRIITPKASPTKLWGIPGLDSPMVGREYEASAFHKALERLQRGSGGIVTVVGEAGIGKSRLLAEIRKAHHLEDQINAVTINWIEGRCLSYGTSIPYLLWIDILRSALDVTLDDSPDIVQKRLRMWVQAYCHEDFNSVYPYLARLLSLPLEAETLVDLSELNPSTLKTRTFEAILRALTWVANHQPLALVCEDLHWADPASLELLEHCLPLIDKASLFMVLIARPYPEHASWQLLDLCRKNYRYRLIDLWLQPLSASDSETLVANLLDIDALSQAQRWRILAKAEGNPFFVEEVIRSLIAMQAIIFDEGSGRWQANEDLREVPLPETLQGVITARIDRLQGDTRHVLQLAAVIGRIFLYQVLAALAKEEHDLHGKLVTLQREELIRERARIPELEYIFKHELTREAAYNGILKRQRKVFHRQVAEALERLYPDRLDEMLALLAYHWQRAEDLRMAATYLIKAGDYARLAYGQDDAVDFYEQAITLLRQLGDEHQLARALMKLGQAYHDALDLERSQQAYDQAFEIWNGLDRSPMPQSPHTYRFIVPEPRSLDPTIPQLIPWDTMFTSYLFAGLVLIDLDGEVIPDMAESWEILDKGHTYIFKIRSDARWSDGKPVTAHDFEFAWRRVLDTDLSAYGAKLFYDVIRGAQEYHLRQDVQLGVRAEDDQILVVELVSPIAYFLHFVGSYIGYPVPRHIIEIHEEQWTELQHFVCNGPFVIASHKPNESMQWQRNPYYNGPFRGNVGRCELLTLFYESSDMAEENQQWTDAMGRYARDEIDWLGIGEALFSETRNEFDQDYYSQSVAALVHLNFDIARRPFDDIRVRQAFVHALDRTEIPSVISGCSDPANGGFLPPGIPGHQPNIGLPYDPDLARKLMEQAGYPNGNHFPSTTFLSLPWDKALADVLAERWQHILDVKVSVVHVNFQTWLTDWKNFETVPHLAITAWEADVLDPDNFLRTALLYNSMRWEHPSYWALVEKALGLSDPGARMELYREADKILIREALVAPLWYGKAHMLFKPWIKYTRESIFATRHNNFMPPLRYDIIESH